MDPFTGKTQQVSIFSRSVLQFIFLFQIKACMEAVDCQADFCLDLFEPSGHGRKRRHLANSNENSTNAVTEFAKFKENIEYSVILPGEYDQQKYNEHDPCRNFMMISGLLALLLTLSTILVSLLC